MNLKTLLLSSDDTTVRVLRRVLSDLEIGIEHCLNSDAAIRRIPAVHGFPAITKSRPGMRARRRAKICRTPARFLYH